MKLDPASHHTVINRESLFHNIEQFTLVLTMRTELNVL